MSTRLISIGPRHPAPPEWQLYTRAPAADGLLLQDARRSDVTRRLLDKLVLVDRRVSGRELRRLDKLWFDDYPNGVWFTWPAAEGATDYRVYVGKASNVYDYYVATGGALQACLFLPENVTHYLMVRSWDGTAESVNSLEFEVLNGVLQPRYALYRADRFMLGDSGVTA